MIRWVDSREVCLKRRSTMPESSYFTCFMVWLFVTVERKLLFTVAYLTTDQCHFFISIIMMLLFPSTGSRSNFKNDKRPKECRGHGTWSWHCPAQVPEKGEMIRRNNMSKAYEKNNPFPPCDSVKKKNVSAFFHVSKKNLKSTLPRFFIFFASLSFFIFFSIFFLLPFFIFWLCLFYDIPWHSRTLLLCGL